MDDRAMLYCNSLYEAADEENCVKDVYESLKVTNEIVCENPDYIRVISSAAINKEERETLVREAFEGRVHGYVVNFLMILAKKRIGDILPSVVKEFEKRYFKENNIENAVIYTAVELKEEKKKEIKEKIEKISKKKIIADFKVDESLVGGIVIETDNCAIDASISGKLQSVKRFISRI